MKVPLLQQAIANYHEHIRKNKHLENAHWWNIYSSFSSHWDLEAKDLADMYDKSFQSQVSRRWWHAEHYEPKKMMLAFISINSDFVRAAFQNLLEEEQPLDTRISRFKAHCDTLYEAYREQRVQTLHGSHYQTEKTIWLYLSLAFPEKYAYHDPIGFQVFLKRMGAQKPLEVYEYERSSKLQKTIHTFLVKNEALIEDIKQRLPTEAAFTPDSYLLVTHFLFSKGTYHFL